MRNAMRVTAALLVVLMALSLGACKSSGSKVQAPAPSPTPVPTPPPASVTEEVVHDPVTETIVSEEVTEELPEDLAQLIFLLDHLAHRQELYLFPDNVGSVDLIAYDLRLGFNRIMDHTMVAHPKVDPINPHLTRVLNESSYGIERYEDGLLLIRKEADRAEGLRELAEIRDVEDFKPRHIPVAGGMVLESIRANGVVGYMRNVLSYTMICEVPPDFSPVPLEFLVKGDRKSAVFTGSTLISELDFVFEKALIGNRFTDELGISIPDIYLQTPRLEIFLLGADGMYYLLDTVAGPLA